MIAIETRLLIAVETWLLKREDHVRYFQVRMQVPREMHVWLRLSLRYALYISAIERLIKDPGLLTVNSL